MPKGLSATSKAISAGNYASMADGTLNKAISSIESRVETLKKIMDEHAFDAANAGLGVPGSSKAGAKKYREAQQEYQQLQHEMNAAKLELSRRKSSINKSSKTFVNSFGEATKRTITSSSYESSQRRTRKAVERNLGVV